MEIVENFTGRRFEIIAFVNNQKPVYYEELTSSGEHGNWILIAVDDTSVFVYTGECNFCPLCPSDHFDDDFKIGPFLSSFNIGSEHQNELERGMISEELRQVFDSNDLDFEGGEEEITVTPDLGGTGWLIDYMESYRSYHVIKGNQALTVNGYMWMEPSNLSVTKNRAKEFVAQGDYRPLLEVPIYAIRDLCEEGRLAKMLPDVVPMAKRAPLAQTIMTVVKMGMGWPPNDEDADADLRARTLWSYHLDIADQSDYWRGEGIGRPDWVVFILLGFVIAFFASIITARIIWI